MMRTIRNSGGKIERLSFWRAVGDEYLCRAECHRHDKSPSCRIQGSPETHASLWSIIMAIGQPKWREMYWPGRSLEIHGRRVAQGFGLSMALPG